MNLPDTLRVIAPTLHLDGETLAGYASAYRLSDADPRIPPGYDFGHADGQFLYALVRGLKPRRVLESGFCRGGSAAYLAAALHEVSRETGDPTELVTVDIAPWKPLLIEYDQPTITLVVADICDYVTRPDATGFQFIHEDASHEAHTVRAIYENLAHLMPAGGVVVSHDTTMGIKTQIFDGIRSAGLDIPPCYAFDESPCGFSVLAYAPTAEPEAKP